MFTMRCSNALHTSAGTFNKKPASATHSMWRELNSRRSSPSAIAALGKWLSAMPCAWARVRTPANRRFVHTQATSPTSAPGPSEKWFIKASALEPDPEAKMAMRALVTETDVQNAKSPKSTRFRSYASTSDSMSVKRSSSALVTSEVGWKYFMTRTNRSPTCNANCISRSAAT